MIYLTVYRLGSAHVLEHVQHGFFYISMPLAEELMV